jgi:hypothetical protein
MTARASSLRTEEVVNRWVESLGGRKKLGQIRNIHTLSATTEGGLEGTFEEWTVMKGRHKRVYTHAGIDSTTTVNDGRRVWLRDWNGKVRELQGTDIKNEVADSLQGNFSSLLPVHIPDQTEFQGQDESGRFYVLKISPKGGRTISLYLDKSSFLPVKSERLNGDYTLTIFYSDWREVKGIKVPFKLRRSTGDPRSDINIEVRDVHFNAPLHKSAFIKPRDTAQDTRFATGNSTLHIPYKALGTFVLVQTKVNGSDPLWFILDSGASLSLINKDRAEALGVPLYGKLEISGAGSRTDFSIAKGVTFTVQGTEVIKQTVGAISLGALDNAFKLPIGGILGYDFFSRFIVKINYEAKTLDLYDPQTYEYDEHGETVPFTIEDGLPYVQGEIRFPGMPTIAGEFLVDTGGTYAATLYRPFVSSHKLSEVARPTAQVKGAQGSEKEFFNNEGMIRWLESFTLGHTAIDKLPVFLTLSEQGAHNNPDYAGYVGGPLLRRFNIVFDYSRHHLILEPNSHFAESFK